MFVFVGRNAARLKHAKAFEIAIRIKDSEYHGNAPIVDVLGVTNAPYIGRLATFAQLFCRMQQKYHRMDAYDVDAEIFCRRSADSDVVSSSATGFWDALDGAPEKVTSDPPEDDKAFEDRLSSESNIFR